MPLRTLRCARLPLSLLALYIFVTACGGGSTDSTTGSSSTYSSTASTSSSSSTSSSTGSSSAAGSLAVQLATRLGKPDRLLVGLSQDVSDIESQDLKVDIYETYLGNGDWTQWNAPPCDYPCKVAGEADAVGAVPMYTYYQMANNGENNMSVLTDSSFMTTYWSRLKTFYLDMATYGKPALLNVEPDFWGFTERNAKNADPSTIPALVTINADCASLTNDVAGVAACILKMARLYAPKVYVGFPPSTWGGDSLAEVIAWMNKVGAQNADYVTEQTLDRDAGCDEAQDTASACTRTDTVYWDETNQTHPNFQDHFAEAAQYHTGIGGLPLIWWQTPLGVPSTTPGGTQYHYRDNRVHYFLTHPAELTAVGGLAVVFSTGESHQTNVTTDGGQFQSLNGAYMANPVPLQ